MKLLVSIIRLSPTWKSILYDAETAALAKRLSCAIILTESSIPHRQIWTKGHQSDQHILNTIAVITILSFRRHFGSRVRNRRPLRCERVLQIGRPHGYGYTIPWVPLNWSYETRAREIRRTQYTSIFCLISAKSNHQTLVYLRKAIDY